ncbi:MAG: SDR family oxidoreductase [Candidatus Rokubacteria bacterium]|nr:SDR family oxidoreductase [Candidatus Rokubacteria bacterium]
MSVLVGKVALVTGASSGIGAATAKALAREGVRVALLARREDRLEEVADEIRHLPGHALVCPADVTDSATARTVVERVLGQWKRIDILVNNAGQGISAPFEATTPEELRALMEVNLVGVLTLTQAILPGMLQHASGHIINVASVSGRRGVPLRSAYNATKFALVGLSESLRQELRGTGVHVSIVYPIVTKPEFPAAAITKAESPRHGPVQTADQVARAIVRCARRPRPEVYPYPPARILAVLSALAPGFVDWMMARFLRR